MKIALAVLLVAVVVFQWFTQQIWLRIWGPFGVSFHRDEWPAFYWIIMGLEVLLAALLIYWSI